MNTAHPITRRDVLAACRDRLQQRRAEYAREIASIDAAAAGETKSSAGDKYETAREMLAQTRTLMERNLHEAETGLSVLERMERQGMQPTANFGSLVETDQGFYLLGLGLGAIDLPGGASVTAISLASPLGLGLKGRKEGDMVPWKQGRLAVLRIKG